MGNYNKRPYYKQRETEGGKAQYLYYVSNTGWLVSGSLGESSGGLLNRQDTDLPPRANWLYANGKKFVDDDQTLKLDYTTLSPCKLVRVAGSGRVLNHQSGRMGYYRLQEGRWSEGRPVYKKGSRSTVKFLLVQEGRTTWGIRSSTTSTSAGIVSGRATNSPTSSRAGGRPSKGVTRWRYTDGERWSEGHISVTCNEGVFG